MKYIVTNVVKWNYTEKCQCTD